MMDSDNEYFQSESKFYLNIKKTMLVVKRWAKFGILPQILIR